MKSNGNGKDIHPPLNPSDPMNSFVYSLGNESDDAFRTMQGIGGVPHRAPKRGVRMYKDDDPEHMRPQPGGQVSCAMFDIGNPNDRIAYEKTASRVFSMQQHGKAALFSVERVFDASKGSWIIYYEWVEYFTYDPTTKKSHRTESEDLSLMRRR